MSNFVSTFKAGIPSLDIAINGLQRKTSIGIAASEKTGKTTLADYAFLLMPYIYMEKENRLDDIEWVYFSLEIDRVSKEFKFAAFFMAYDYQQYNFVFKDKIYQMNKEYLMGRQTHKNNDNTTEFIPITPEHESMLKEIYLKRIIPLFGEYNEDGDKLRNGKIDFIESPENPTGLYKYLESHAKKNGQILYQEYTVHNDKNILEKRRRIIGYKSNNPNKYNIVICDHIRRIPLERGFTLKQNVDKWLEYTSILRNLCYFTFINICHINRGLSNIDRLKFAGEYIFPSTDDIKDTGNLGEESTFVLTLFNPNDEKYNIDKHFGVEIKNYPNYRSLHLVASRDTEFPLHIQLNMFGGINMFSKLNI